MQKGSLIKAKILYFVLGLTIATLICSLNLHYIKTHPYHELIGDDIINTECEELLIRERITSYRHGYMTCLDEVAPEVFEAFHQSKIDLAQQMINNDSILENYIQQYHFKEHEKMVLINLLKDRNY